MTTEAKPESQAPNIITNLGEVVEVRAGDVYEFLFDTSTRAGHVHRKGTHLYVIDHTTSAPHGEIGESGQNWVCRTEFGESVWATLEQGIARGLYKKVGNFNEALGEVLSMAVAKLIQQSTEFLTSTLNVSKHDVSAEFVYQATQNRRKDQR